MKPIILTTLASFLIAGCQPNTHTTAEANSEVAEAMPVQTMLIDGFDPNIDAASYAALCNKVLTKAKSDFAALESATGPATLENVVAAFDQITYDMQEVRQSWYVKSVHPDASIRDAATKCSEDYSDFSAQVGLSRGYYERLESIDSSSLSKSDKYML